MNILTKSILQEGIWNQDDFIYVLKPFKNRSAAFSTSKEAAAKSPHVLIKFKEVTSSIHVPLKKRILDALQKDDGGRYLLTSWRKQQRRRQGIIDLNFPLFPFIRQIPKQIPSYVHLKKTGFFGGFFFLIFF